MLARFLSSNDRTEEIRIFYSYSRSDKSFRALIDDVLGRFKWDVSVRTWYDGEIPAGAQWEREIFRNIDSAQIILLFLSHQFMASNYCRTIELPRALERERRGEATVIPVLIEPEANNAFPELDHLQFLPRDRVAVNAWPDKRAAVRNVVQGIVDIIANANLKKDGRCRWQVRLAGDFNGLNEEREFEIVQSLRQRANDPTLRPVGVGSGSVMFYVESSLGGLTTFKSWFSQQSQPRIAAWEVISVLELFGAGIQAAFTEESLPPPAPNSGSLLLPSEPFAPAVMKGIRLDPTSPLRPNFIIDRGDVELPADDFAAESQKLVAYFVTAVAVPEDELWVNLTPDESNRMLGKSLSGTNLGRQLLDVDLKLKQLAASLLHPDCETGRAFWADVAARNGSEHGPQRASLSTFQKVWIVPQRALVYSHADDNRSAYVINEEIAVLSEDQYMSRYSDMGRRGFPDGNDICTPAFREIVLPAIEREIRTGRTFAPFRQAYYGIILAAWLKRHAVFHPAWKPFIDSGSPRQLVAAVSGVRKAGDIHDFLGIRNDDEKNEVREAAVSDESLRAGAHSHTSSAETRETPKDTLRREAQLRRLTEAMQLRRIGKSDAAIRVLRAVLADLENEGALHLQDGQMATMELGLALRAIGDFMGARAHLDELLRVRRHMLGDDHPHTVESIRALGEVLRAMGEAKAATALENEADDRTSRVSEAFSIRENREFFERYMQIFHGGVFRFSRHDFDPPRGERICRTYFSGCIDLRDIRIEKTADPSRCLQHNVGTVT